MPSDYTPTTEDVRAAYRASHRWPDGTELRGENPRIEAEFNRWLAAHDAELRESIATEIEAEAEPRRFPARDFSGNPFPDLIDVARAARIARREADQ